TSAHNIHAGKKAPNNSNEGAIGEYIFSLYTSESLVFARPKVVRERRYRGGILVRTVVLGRILAADTGFRSARAEGRQGGELARRSEPQQHVFRGQDRASGAQGSGRPAVLSRASRRNAVQRAIVSSCMAQHHRNRGCVEALHRRVTPRL